MKRLPTEQELEKLNRGLRKIGASPALARNIVNEARKYKIFTTETERDEQERKDAQEDRLSDLLTRSI
jgi:hypothetical protein